MVYDITYTIEAKLMEDAVATECGLEYISLLYMTSAAYIAEYRVLDAKKLAWGMIKHNIQIYTQHHL